MNLKDYLSTRDMTIKEFAERIGVSTGTIFNYLAHRRTPTLKIGKLIEEATKGKVSIKDLLNN